MHFAIENSEENAVCKLVFLEIARFREEVRLIMEDACSHSLPLIRALYEQCQGSFEKSGGNLFNEQKKLSCGKLSDRMIVERMLQRVAENNHAKISNYKPSADNLKIPWNDGQLSSRFDSESFERSAIAYPQCHGVSGTDGSPTICFER
jgi:hypothetical protein